MEEPEDRDLLALFGLTAGQAVVWYTGQFYALFFLTQTLKVDGATANILIAAALLIGTPFFIVFGSLSDKIGRKPIIMAGCLLAGADLLPDLQGAHPLRQSRPAASKPEGPGRRDGRSATSARSSSTRSAPSVHVAATSPSRLLFDGAFPTPNETAPAGTVAQIKVGQTVIQSYTAAPATSAGVNRAPTAGSASVDTKAAGAAFDKSLSEAAHRRGLSGQG